MANDIKAKDAVPQLKPADWHGEVVSFIEHQLEKADEEERDLAMQYFKSCLSALAMCSQLGIRISKIEGQ
jgi:hypothetical protein